MKKVFLLVSLCVCLFALTKEEMLNKGNMFASQQEFTEAANWFKKAADENVTEAMYNLGYLYSVGLGVANDMTQAAFWYENAAKLGHVNSQVNLGFMYVGGQGVKQDFKQAAFWLKKAKESGHPKAIMLWDEFKLEQY